MYNPTGGYHLDSDLESVEMQAAIFLDRDGVLIQDVELLVHFSQARLLDGAARVVREFKQAGYCIVVISNQAIVARGLASEQQVSAIHTQLQAMLVSAGGLPVDAFYFCPHHPNATLLQYRLECDCRKPRPGLLFRAASDLDLNLNQSYMVGDRITDIIAGHRAGCKTILLQSGKHTDPPIQMPDSIDVKHQPDFVCSHLSQVLDIILRTSA